MLWGVISTRRNGLIFLHLRPSPIEGPDKLIIRLTDVPEDSEDGEEMDDETLFGLLNNIE